MIHVSLNPKNHDSVDMLGFFPPSLKDHFKKERAVINQARPCVCLQIEEWAGEEIWSGLCGLERRDRLG